MRINLFVSSSVFSSRVLLMGILEGQTASAEEDETRNDSNFELRTRIRCRFVARQMESWKLNTNSEVKEDYCISYATCELSFTNAFRVICQITGSVQELIRAACALHERFSTCLRTVRCQYL